ncbi:Glycosyltransferase involved in cell wall bisynthesis [Chryseobacterium ureilyticum]|uniref:Glycosyltransferase involved in cell wall bisynthesis n=1 Tax=Chryseobacterium ureilyticum TaxID=373668 RepID=A0A1N7LX60_9FLAO|nr:glycosyltransferase family 4 protein [Chryseobacterium ureilyticum]SIS78369.1 Glycosyltransferase involved in cell wall bisynthesis [Chryseobacterium ureilyticum]
MKIIIPLVGSFGKSGGFRVLSKLSNYWIEEGHDVIFLSYVNGDLPYFPTKAKLLYYDNKGNVVEHQNNDSAVLTFGMFRLRKFLRKALDTLEADVVLANHSFSALPVKNSKIKAKKCYYVQAYEPEFYGEKGLKNYILRRISKNSYTLGLDIIVNALMYQNYKELKTDKVVFPGLDLNTFKPLSLSKNGNKIILGTIGRSEIHKGTIYILEAFKLLRKELGTKIELHIAFGEKDLENFEGIKVVTPDGDHKLAEYYNSLDAYICGGILQMEAIHYPVIESMACGVPVITTGYYPASLDNAFMVPIKNSEAIKDAVMEFIDNPILAELKKNRAFTNIEQFDWKLISQKMLTYFSQ